MNEGHHDGPKNGREYWTLKSLKELMDERERRNEERERRIEERFTREREERETSVSAALAAQKEQTRDSFLSSEKAIVKAESAQTAHNLLATELQDRLDRQATNFIARPEFDSRIAGIEGKVADLRESRSTDRGTKVGARELWGYVAFAIGLALAVYSALSK